MPRCNAVRAISIAVMGNRARLAPLAFILTIGAFAVLPGLAHADAEADAALILGARAGRLDVVEGALAAGADVNAADETRFTALMAAALGDHLGIVRRLLAAGALTEPRDGRFGNTALAIAARHGNVDSVSALLNAGADVNARATSDGLTPLMQAAASLDDRAPEVIGELLAAGADTGAVDTDGWSALHHAAAVSTPSAVALLVDAGMDVNGPATPAGAGTLELAVVGGRPETAAALLTFGADPNTLGTHGHTPLMRAARKGRDDMAALLIGVGADVNARGAEDGSTALMWAANGAFIAIVRDLLTAGADVTPVADDGWTALRAAEMTGDADVMRLIVEAGG